MMLAVATDMPIGTRIQRRRHVLGMTQQDLAALVGVSKSTVANWEVGKHFPRRYLGKVEAVLGISLLDGCQHPVVLPPGLMRSLDRLTPEQRQYVIDLLTGRSGDDDPPARHRRVV